MKKNNGPLAIPLVRAHPHTLKYFQLGHPWATQDSFTDRWPKAEEWLRIDQGTESFWILHDPKHSKVKGRLWFKGNFNDTPPAFDVLLAERIEKSLRRRSHFQFENNRDNFYLIFGEADELPGIHLIALGTTLLLQLRSFWWENKLPLLQDLILKNISLVFENNKIERLIFESREDSKKAIRKVMWGTGLPDITEVCEYGINYQLHWGHHYDHGIYTDMSSIRPLLNQEFQNKRVLNLYCYSGAFSLYALAQRATQVVSVDLAPIYLQWLEKNLQLNPHISEQNGRHVALELSVEKALLKLHKEGQTFDLIVADPPSFSSDGERATSSFQNYPPLIQACLKVLAPKGKMALFLNTHSVTRAKFRTMLTGPEHSVRLKIMREFRLSSDCATPKGFPEGDYLKGALVAVN